MAHYFAAVDLGATSGRVILGSLDSGRFSLREVSRFPTPTCEVDGHLHWDSADLTSHVIEGLRAAIEIAPEPLSGIGVDTWGVDYACVDSSGKLMAEPYHYRDERTRGVPQDFYQGLPADALYAENGLQAMDFNTVFQIASEGAGPSAHTLGARLFLPDWITYNLTGLMRTELTIASTSGLLNARTRDWSPSIANTLRERYSPPMFPELIQPGTVVGPTKPSLFPTHIPVIAVASHDTASAVVSIPSLSKHPAFISCGTWSLIGIERDEPILTDESREANFTNEFGIDGTVRYLRNVAGLWVLTQCQQAWKAKGQMHEIAPLLEAASSHPALVTVLDMEDQRLIHPADMVTVLDTMARQTNQPVPSNPAEYTRCIIDSLAVDYRKTVRRAGALAGQSIDTIHIVGGGTKNALLNQMTADATGLPVTAGPAEATALGNLLVQARAVRALPQGVQALRQVVIDSCDIETYIPRSLFTAQQWADAERRAFGWTPS